MSVHIDLNGEGKPGGDADMHETELPIQKVKVEAQTLPAGTEKIGAILTVNKFEALAGFHSGKHTYKPFCDAITSGDLPGFIILTDRPIYRNVGPPSFFSHSLCMFLNSFGVSSNKSLEILEEKPLSVHKPFHGLRPTDGQVPFKQNSIKTSYRSSYFLCMLIDEFFHGVLPYVDVAEQTH